MLQITRLAVEGLERDCVTDNPRPEFSYMTESDRTDNAVIKAVLEVNGWRCETAEQTGIVYGGVPLAPLTAYPVTLRVEDRYGETAEASAVFETGKLATPWNGKWITDGAYVFRERKTSPRPMLFRKELTIEKPLKRARIFATAIGIYDLRLNGRKVGDDYFAPGFTSYRHQLQYQVYDVTDLLTPRSVLTATVAGGWAVGSYTYFRRNRVYGKKQAFLCELRLEYADGASEWVGSDESFRVTMEGSLRAADLYDGEVYDATVDLEKVSWRPAAVTKPDFSPNLLAEYGAPVRAHEELRPVSVSKAPSGELIYDMGQNFAGVIRARIRGKRGQKLIFRHAEILMNGELYTQPLRSAKQRAEYTCTDGEQEYSPTMTYMGFRYVGVSGIDKADLQLSALALYADMNLCGAFSCSDDMLNRLQSAIVWGERSNFIEIPTDCPQRDERLGWTGDIALFAPTACYNYDCSRFLEKWLLDVKAEQGRGGGIPTIVPQVKIYNQYEMFFTMAIDHWGDCCIWAPWAEYRARGNPEILRRMYPTMRRYLAACRRWAEWFSFGKRGRVWSLGHHYGDWCAVDTDFRGWMRRGKWTATACLAYSAGIVAQIADLLGEAEDAEEYRRLSRETAEAYRTILIDADGKIRGFRERTNPAQTEFLTAYVLPLYYGLLEGEQRRKAAARLAALVREGGWHVTTGFPGTPYLLFALLDNGYVEDAYKTLLNDTCPSWLYEIKAGGTTTWERWDALREDGTVNAGDGGGMVSFNHYAAGAVGDFPYRRVVGIEPLEGGYRTFRIAPVPGGGLDWARGTVRSAYGTITAEWRLKNGRYYLEIQVPMGSECQAVLPDGTTEQVGSGRHRYEWPAASPTRD